MRINLIKASRALYAFEEIKIPYTRLPNCPAGASKETRAQIIEASHNNGNGMDAVMLSFQETMLLMTSNFLQAQQQVMLAYLQCKSATPLLPAMPALAPPTQQSHCHSVQSEPAPVSLMPVAEHSFELASMDASAPPKEVKRNPSPTCVEAESNIIKVDINTIELETSMSVEDLISAFVGLVSERTGYPVEMLDPALDLESDLGIDSIKRVEILSNFRKLLPESWQENFEGDLEEIGGLRTLDAISEWIRRMPLKAESRE